MTAGLARCLTALVYRVVSIFCAGNNYACILSDIHMKSSQYTYKLCVDCK